MTADIHCLAGLSTVDEGSERESTNRELHKPSAFINLATTFLYMTNYYIVGPTSAEVCILKYARDELVHVMVVAR